MKVLLFIHFLGHLTGRKIHLEPKPHFSKNGLAPSLRLLESFPGGSVVQNVTTMQKMQVQPLGQEDPPGAGNGNPLQCFA